MDANVLQECLNERLTQRQIGDRLGCSQTNIKYWVAKYKLNVPKKHKACALCGETDLAKFYTHKDGSVRYRCKRCDNIETIKRFREYKRQAVEYKGGRCVMCGYNACLGSLDFHHTDPDSKDPNWTRMRTWQFDKIKDELDKCILVCRNCHGEIHYKLGD